MDDDLFAEAEAATERASLVPGEGFFVPDSIEHEREAERVSDALADADVVVIADPDADGLACVALIRSVHGDATLVDAGPHEISRGLEYVTEHAPAGVDVYVCDLCPDDVSWLADPLAALTDHAEAVHWYDHHQWDETVEAAVRAAGVDLVVGESETECSADVTARSLDDEVPRRLLELAAVTRDHDLWIRDDPRSDDLADYAYWANPEQYLETIIEHGADLPEDVQEYLAERRLVKDDRIERAVRRAEFLEIGGVTIGVTYGRSSQNEVAEAMREAGADAAVVVKPAGSASLRGTDGFQRCHEVANLVNGGGHPKAAGCKPDIYRDVLDYAHHWTTEGATAKRVILEAFRDVVDGEVVERGADSAAEDDDDGTA